jgi:hypothetical protein
MSTEEKQCVRNMGFGELLNMKVIEVSGTLSCYMLERFNATTMTIALPCGNINLSRDTVHDIMGLPMGATKITELPFRSPEHTSYTNWYNQYNKTHVRIHDVKRKIIESTNTDMNFKLNFLVLMINSLIESSSYGKANLDVLNYVTEDVDITDLDWCSLLLDSLTRNKFTYNPSKPGDFFVGPSAFLMVS